MTAASGSVAMLYGGLRTTRMTLTPGQAERAAQLLPLVEDIGSAITDEHSNKICRLIKHRFSIALFRERSIFFASGQMAHSQQYGQITHMAAAITYCLRSKFIDAVATRVEPELRSTEAVDRDVQKYLNPAGPTPYGYCVQVHGACRTYGSKHVRPTITWANSQYTALRLASGELLTVGSLKNFVNELLSQCRELVADLSFGIQLPRQMAKDMSTTTAHTALGKQRVQQNCCL
ncbi:hypothetical protein V1509DRAFT_640342 [Lipomyces kononenkoae]